MLFVYNSATCKTLTPETIADKVQKPLCILSVGEFGQNPTLLERTLRDALELMEKWNAILLFDEFDVFLQQRSVEHLGHGQVVAIFLRPLEYYHGILNSTV
ncbi:hypothetical protein BDV09DRAFT_196675 [Aspergillus tetrazonus]